MKHTALIEVLAHSCACWWKARLIDGPADALLEEGFMPDISGPAG